MKLVGILCVTFFTVCAVGGYLYAKHPAEKLYRVRQVVEVADAAKCAKDGGKAFMVADLNDEGGIASQWQAGCILEVK